MAVSLTVVLSVTVVVYVISVVGVAFIIAVVVAVTFAECWVIAMSSLLSSSLSITIMLPDIDSFLHAGCRFILLKVSGLMLGPLRAHLMRARSRSCHHC